MTFHQAEAIVTSPDRDFVTGEPHGRGPDQAERYHSEQTKTGDLQARGAPIASPLVGRETAGELRPARPEVSRRGVADNSYPQVSLGNISEAILPAANDCAPRPRDAAREAASAGKGREGRSGAPSSAFARHRGKLASGTLCVDRGESTRQPARQMREFLP